MASSKDYLQFVLEQLSELQELLCNLLRGWEAAMAVKERTTIALDPEVKREATDVLERMGLSLSW